MNAASPPCAVFWHLNVVFAAWSAVPVLSTRKEEHAVVLRRSHRFMQHERVVGTLRRLGASVLV
jgi:hypothetical protein